MHNSTRTTTMKTPATIEDWIFAVDVIGPNDCDDLQALRANAPKNAPTEVLASIDNILEESKDRAHKQAS